MLSCHGFRSFEESQHVSTEVNQESSEFKALMDYMCQTSGGSPPRMAKPGEIPEQFGQKRRNALLGHRSHDTVTAIYRISREGEAERFKDTWACAKRKGRPALGLMLAWLPVLWSNVQHCQMRSWKRNQSESEIKCNYTSKLCFV